MKTEKRTTIQTLAATDRVLFALSDISRWNTRIALGLFDPIKYDRYLYFKRVRERNEAQQRERRRARQALSVLIRAGHAIDTGGIYRLTPSGWLKFSRVYAKTIKKLKKRQKEHSNRSMIVAFDIPEKQRAIRNTLRQLLYSLRFSQFQRSVFISDNPEAFEVISKIVSNADIANYVKLMVVDRIM